MSITIKEFVNKLKQRDILDVLIQADVLSDDEVFARKIRCPFHHDKTPSFHFYEDNFYCFSCSEHGDVISYIQKVFDLSFTQAVLFLSERLDEEVDLKGHINPFKSNNPNRVPQKKLDSEWDSYLKAMSNASESVKKGAEIFFPLEVGYDSRINYYVLRYTSKTGKTLGFTKRRAFDDENRPKWIHSNKDDSNIAECSNMFNLGNAILEIRNKREVVLVEGPKDVIPFLNEGIKNVVAISGTHNIKNVFEMLPEIEKVVLSLDGDEAGRKGEIDIVSFLSKVMQIEDISYIPYLDYCDPFDWYVKHKSIPERRPVTEIFSDFELKGLYAEANLYNKEKILEQFSKEKNVSIDAAKSVFNRKAKEKRPQDEFNKLVSSKDKNTLEKLGLKFGIE